MDTIMEGWLGQLLIILRLTKQSLSRILNQLVKLEYINMTVGIDKRTKRLLRLGNVVHNDIQDSLTRTCYNNIHNDVIGRSLFLIE